MNNSRMEIIATLVLLISFFFFLVSYSNYDLRKKRGWRGETSPFTQAAVKITESRDNSVSRAIFLEHSLNKNTYRSMVRDKKDNWIPENIFNHKEVDFRGIYSQLIFHDKTAEENFDDAI